MLEAFLRLTQPSETVEVDGILEATRSVVEGEVAHLALDASAVDRDRPRCGSECTDDGGERAIAELDVHHLGEDRLFPGLVAVPGLLAPRLARRGVQLAVTPVAEGAVALEAAATQAAQQATEEINPRGVAGPPPWVLARRTSSTRAHSSSDTGGSERQGAGLRVSSRPRR